MNINVKAGDSPQWWVRFAKAQLLHSKGGAWSKNNNFVFCIIYPILHTKETLNTSNRHQALDGFVSTTTSERPSRPLHVLVYKIVAAHHQSDFAKRFSNPGFAKHLGFSNLYINVLRKKSKTIQPKVEQSLRDLHLKPMFMSINGWMGEKNIKQTWTPVSAHERTHPWPPMNLNVFFWFFIDFQNTAVCNLYVQSLFF